MKAKLPFIVLVMAVMVECIYAKLDDDTKKFLEVLNKTTYDKNNPLDLPTKKTLFYQYGVTFDLYKSDNEVRNLVVPLSGYKEDNLILPHPPIFFNMYKDGNSLGQYIMDNFTVHKINDGRDSTFETLDIYQMNSGPQDMKKDVYIGAADGIYVYDIDTGALNKYGTITDDIIAIDKVIGEDEFYILKANHKVYKVINQGTETVPVEAIPYAKDLVLDWFENVYFIGEDNVPQVLLKEDSAPHKFSEFNFKVERPILGREVLDVMSKKKEAMIPYIVDGAVYILTNNKSLAVPSVGVVPGVTAFSAEYCFDHYYAVDGLIYQHAILGHEIRDNDLGGDESGDQSTTESDAEKEPPVTVFNRDVRAEYNTVKKMKRRH